MTASASPPSGYVQESAVMISSVVLSQLDRVGVTAAVLPGTQFAVGYLSGMISAYAELGNLKPAGTEYLGLLKHSFLMCFAGDRDRAAAAMEVMNRNHIKKDREFLQGFEVGRYDVEGLDSGLQLPEGLADYLSPLAQGP